ncbi:MAG: hypothetical protein L6R36_006175 [Xanthoria steineri]|nr:MAG: hypothetical protein L6R36_006175 [Xanthoria steineri]
MPEIMCGLVGYGSSDSEERDGDMGAPEANGAAASTFPSEYNSQTSRAYESNSFNTHDSTATSHDNETAASNATVLRSALVGPRAPPAHVFATDGSTSPLSPYFEKRATIRNLTLPTVVDLNIPPSPPGSPPPGLSQKFEHFMLLKKQGMHFNDKLAGSSALKNPMLLQKLMSSAGLITNDQYATTLPKDLWDPTAFPAWAYKEELAKGQQDITSKKEDENTRRQRDCIEFIPATNQGS